MSNSAVAIAAAGARLKVARAVVVMLHGRGGSADDILSLAGALRQADLAYIAPRAPGNTWYPQSFLAPLEQNEPYLSRSLATVEIGRSFFVNFSPWKYCMYLVSNLPA